MRILYPQSPNFQPDRHQPTRDFIEKIAEKYDIYTYQCKEPFDYYYFLRQNWNVADIIIIEADNITTFERFESFVNCKEKDCSFSYPTLSGSYIVNGCKDAIKGDFRNCKPVPYDCQWSDCVGLGLTKISRETQNKISGWFKQAPIKWQFIDGLICMHTFEYGIKWHLHGKCEHNHGYTDIKQRVINSTDNIELLGIITKDIRIYKDLTNKSIFYTCVHHGFKQHVCGSCYDTARRLKSYKGF